MTQKSADSEQSTPEPTAPAEGAPRRPLLASSQFIVNHSSFQSVVDELINEAMERGDFDNLRGKGRPLTVEENSFAGDWELAFKMLKDNDFTLPWIADRNQALADIAAWRQQATQTWRVLGPELRAMLTAGRRPAALARWRAVLALWQTHIQELNHAVDRVNVYLPVRQLEIYRLTLADELRRLGAPPDEGAMDSWPWPDPA